MKINKYIRHTECESALELCNKEDNYDFGWKDKKDAEIYSKFRSPIEVKVIEKLEGRDGCSDFTAYNTDKGYFAITAKVRDRDGWPKFIDLIPGEKYFIEPIRCLFPYYRWQLSNPKQKMLF